MAETTTHTTAHPNTGLRAWATSGMGVTSQLPHPQLPELVAQSYARRVLNEPLYRAVLMLLTHGVLPGFAAYQAAARRQLAAHDASRELGTATRYLRESHDANEVIVTLTRGDDLLAACNLYLVDDPRKLPILQHMCLPERALPAGGRALELGRFVTANGADDSPDRKDVDASPFLLLKAALDHAREACLLPGGADIVCGGTHGVMLEMLHKLGFPITTVAAALARDALDGPGGGFALSNLPRIVLGSVSQSQLRQALHTLSWQDAAAARVAGDLLVQGFAQLRLPGDAATAHELVGLKFFHFPFNDARTAMAMRKLERIAARYGCAA